MNVAVSVPNYKSRQRRWFVGMIGKQVFCEATKYTSAEARRTLIQLKMVKDAAHAEALYLYHKDHKINFTEVKTKQ